MAAYQPCDIGFHVDCLEREGALLGGAAQRAGLRAGVPGCPGWAVRDVLAHIGFVHRWAAGVVAEGRTRPVPGPSEEELLRQAPAGEELLAWYRDGHAALVRTLRAAPPDLEYWTFLPGTPSPLAFWARRQAHETAIHRMDVDLAAGAMSRADGAAPDPYPARLAADGADELLTGFLARKMRAGRWRGTPGVLGIHADDGPAGQADWLVATGPDASSAARGTGPADCNVTGSAASLYLALWNRAPVDGLQLQGDAGLLASLRNGLQVRW